MERHRVCGGLIQLFWEEALGACPNGYRLPNPEDILSIFDNCGKQFDLWYSCKDCSESALCSSMFGDIYMGFAWTTDDCSEPKQQEEYGEAAWYMDFLTGYGDCESREAAFMVQCLRDVE